MGGLLRVSAIALIGFLLFATVPASAGDHPSSSNCNVPCTIKADKPIDLMLTGCTGGALSMATYAGRSINQGGGPGCGTADFWTVAVGNNVYTSGELNGVLRTTKSPDGKTMIQSFRLQQFGEDIVLQANYTLVRNGTIIRYTAHNHDSAPADLGFKYSWDLSLESNNDPKIFVDNRPGDGKGAKGTYGENDVSLGPASNDVQFVKVWQTRNGPDGDTDLKQYFWWAEAWGGTPPDLVQYMDSGRAISQANSFTYQPELTTITESEFQTYFGKPDLIHLEPDDNAPGGDDEREFIIWMGTGIPEPLITYKMAANFPQRGPDANFATAFVEAGGKATYLIRVASLTGLNNGKPLPMRYHVEPVAQVLPKGWGVQLLDDQSGQPAQDVILNTGEEHFYRLVISAPKDAYGKDVARVVVRASLADPPAGLYNKKESIFEVPLATTTIVKAQYGLGLKAPEEVLPVAAGESIEFPLQVTNIGNLRDPFNVEMLFAAGGTTFTKEMSPQVFTLARGATQEVKVRLSVPADAFGGEQTLVLQATEPDSQQTNKTAVRVRVVSDSDIQIVADQREILLPPGATGTFKATVYNLGFGDADLDLHGSANQVCEVVAGSPEGCTYAEDSWKVDVDTGGKTLKLPPGGSQKIAVRVTAPSDAKSGEQRAVLLSASKTGATAVVAEELVRAVVQRVSQLTATPLVTNLAGDPGRLLEYALKVRNDGNSLENLTIEMAKLPAGWTATVVPDRFELADGQERTVSISVAVAPDAHAGVYELQALARNADQKQSAKADLASRINQVFGADITTETAVVRILPTDRADVLFEVTNRGNGPDAFTISGIPTTWDVTMTPDVTPLLAPGESALVRLQGTLGGNIGSQTVPLLPVSSTRGDAVSDEPLPFTLIVSRPDLYVRSVRLLSEASHAGDLEVITAEVENLGGIEAKGVRVTLFVDGEPTGTSVDFERLAPDRVLIASLPWSRTPGEHVYRVEVDPEAAIDEGDGESNNAAVLRSPGAASKGLPLLGAEGKLAGQFSPGPGGPLLLLALLGAAALVLRRREQ